MTLELERASTTETVAEARLGSLGGALTEAQRAELADRLRAGGVPHEDMRDWLQHVDALGELRVVDGVDIDLWKFPTPKWHEQDGGRYLGTGVCVITRDPDSDWINMGTYRVMIHDRNRTGLYISPGKHGRMHRDKAFEKGEPLPVVVVPGMDPLLFIASCLEMAPGVDELA